MRGLPVSSVWVVGSFLLLSGSCSSGGSSKKMEPEAGIRDGVGPSEGQPAADAVTEAAGSGGISIGGAGGSGGGGTSAAGADGSAASGGAGGRDRYDGAIDQLVPPDLRIDSPDPIDQGQGSSCTGKPDFTPCMITTAPDRKYDICAGGICVSPGCGDESCNAPGPHFPLADTGQRTCASSSAVIACPAAGAPFFGQDAQYGWDTQHAGSERFTRTSAAEPAVTDTVTGLAWQGCAAGLGGNDCTTGTPALKTWQDAVAYCDALSWGGYQDWHLPDMYELDSIDDVATTLDTTAFPASLQSGKSYWSSSTVAGHTPLAWTDHRGAGIDKTNAQLVRCVRGGSALQKPRFSKDTSSASQPTVVDGVSGLTWQGCVGAGGANCSGAPSDVSLWSDALAYCESLTWAGQSDWRLPNWKELRSIIDSRKAAPAIDTALFPGTPFGSLYWTSTSDRCSGTTCYTWSVSFSDGQANTSTPKSSFGYARCVRGGK